MVVRGAIATAIGLAMTLGGCYQPELRDCTVTCSAPDDCGADQVCGADGFCSDPAVAGTCDGSGGGTAAGGMLRLTMTGKGQVTVATPAFACAKPDCSLAVAPAARLQLTATGLDGHRFDAWTSATCAGQGAICSVTAASGTTTISVRFVKGSEGER